SQAFGAQVGVVRINWPHYLSGFPDGNVPPPVSELARAERRLDGRSAPGSGARSAGTGSDAGAILTRLREALPGERQALLAGHVRERAARVLRLPDEHGIDPGQPLHELGLDSLMAVELRNALSLAVGQTLPATLLFDYPNIEALVGYLAREV